MGWFSRGETLVTDTGGDVESQQQGGQRSVIRSESEPAPGGGAGGDVGRDAAREVPRSKSEGATLYVEERREEEDDGDASPKAMQDLTTSELASLRRLQSIVRVMDSGIRVPIVGYKFGLDAIVGVVPYLGDAAGALVGTYIMATALQFHLPRRLVAHMAVNQAIDCCIGIVPFLGDLFDFGYKANRRNMKLLEAHLERPRAARRADSCFLCGVFFTVVVLPFTVVLCVIGGIIVGILAAVGVIR